MANYLDVVERIQQYYRPRPRRGLRDRLNPMEDMDEVQFRARYRLSKLTVVELCEMLNVDLNRHTNRSHSIPVLVQVLTALRFYGSGAFQLLHGDDAGLSQPSVSRIIESVSTAIATRRADFIKFPDSEAEIRQTQNEFFEYSNFPGVIGAIDGTHIPIKNPGGEYGLFFLNRKSRYSINVQAVCNHHGTITNVVARWPGSAHDSRVFNESTLKTKLENNQYENCWLLGDSGYGCFPYLMTPLLHPEGGPQVRYNTAHKRGRGVIERTFGRLKKRFFCLKGLRLKLETTLTTIVAIFVLWNISILRNEPELDGPNVPEIPGDDFAHFGQGNGHAQRLRIIRDHFTN